MTSKNLVSKELASKDFKRQMSGYGLTTAQILYRRPDHQWLLQTFVWQNYDLFPKFPELQRFLAFWVEPLEGPLHSVMVAHSRLIKPAELKAIDGEFRLNVSCSFPARCRRPGCVRSSGVAGEDVSPCETSPTLAAGQKSRVRP